MRRATAVVLALYPRRVRERYGDEIADLLADSRQPVRDLFDVARAALGERLLAIVRVDLRAAARRVPRRAVIGFVAVLAVLTVPLAFALLPTATVPIGFAAGLLVAGRDRRLRTARALTAGLLALFVAPHLMQLIAGSFDRIAEVASTAAFAMVAVGLAVLAIRSGRRRAALASAVGFLALPYAATTMFVWLNRPDGADPWLAYWMSVLPYGRWRDLWALNDVLVYYPALYTWCAWFLAAYCLRTNATSDSRTHAYP